MCFLWGGDPVSWVVGVVVGGGVVWVGDPCPFAFCYSVSHGLLFSVAAMSSAVMIAARMIMVIGAYMGAPGLGIRMAPTLRGLGVCGVFSCC